MNKESGSQNGLTHQWSTRTSWKYGGGRLFLEPAGSGRLQSYLKDGDGTDGDHDDNPDVHFGGELSTVVGIIVLVVLLGMVQHVVVVAPGVLILRTRTTRHYFCP